MGNSSSDSPEVIVSRDSFLCESYWYGVGGKYCQTRVWVGEHSCGCVSDSGSSKVCWKFTVKSDCDVTCGGGTGVGNNFENFSLESRIASTSCSVYVEVTTFSIISSDTCALSGEYN